MKYDISKIPNGKSGNWEIEEFEVLEKKYKLEQDLFSTCKELETLREKVRLCMKLGAKIIISEYYPEFIEAWTDLRATVDIVPKKP